MEKKEAKIIVVETSVPVIAYAAPPRDKDKKLIKDSEGKTVKGKVLGTGKAFQYSLNKAGNESYIKRYGYKDGMEMVNQKLITKERNQLAADGKAPEKGVKSKCSLMVGMIQKNIALKPIFITEVQSWDCSKESKDEIVAILEAVEAS